MANRSGKRAKKPLQTTLGKASCQNEKEVDLSHVRKPIHTSIFGLQQVLSLYQTSTEEVQNYIKYECDIMYECRTCRTIFRSLANFVLHKRSYCRDRFNPLDLLKKPEDDQENGSSECLQHQEESRPVTPVPIDYTNKEVKKSLTPIIEKLKEKQKIQQLAREALNEDLSFKEIGEDTNKVETIRNTDINHDLLLEEIATNNAAVFQTILQNLPKKETGKPEFMKSEVMEIHGILDSDEAVLGADGKICNFQTNKINENPIIPRGELFCTECNLKFSTKKTLTYHIKYKHNNTRLVFVCPDCKDTFANAWCVYRHLYKIHRKTSAQIKRMREQVHNSCIRKDQEPTKKREKRQPDRLDKVDDDNQWLNNIEDDNDFQMCGGCGKRFERKAALHSHAQMCIKRIAVCNTIKENSARKKDEDGKNRHQKLEKAGPSDVVKGSSKRKPALLRSYKLGQKIFSKNSKQTSTKEIEENSDLNVDMYDSNNCDRLSEKFEENDTHVIVEANISSNISSEDNRHCTSVTIDKLDTEKLLSIIGIKSSNEDVGFKGVQQPDNNSDEMITESLTDCRTHTAIDFDLFCQNIATKLAQSNAPEHEEENIGEMVPKRLPLIVRRNSLKSDKVNSSMDQTKIGESIVEKKLEATSKDETEIECHVEDRSSQFANSPSTSTFKISVKSLDDLIGVPSDDTESHKNENDLTDNNLTVQQTDLESNEHFSNISATIRANISPVKLHKKFSESNKRKRVGSGDYVRNQKFIKSIEKKSFQDISFISRASPYMDQTKRLCVPCQSIFPTLTKLLWHMSAHFSWFRFQCSRCSFISFNKWDCANHAREKHKVMKSSIASIVLPIPNWKSLLMAHDFCMLKDENELSGKHTDEVISGSLEELTVENNKVHNISDTTSNSLFEDSKTVDFDQDNNFDVCGNPAICVKDEAIDIVDEIKDSFQVEVPQEIYTLDVCEIIKSAGNDDNRERLRLGSPITIKPVLEEIENNFCIPSLPHHNGNNGHPFTKIKEEIVVDENILIDDREDIINISKRLDVEENKNEDSNSETEETSKKASHSKMYMRPIRNRTKSIKTLQEDFFYDLSKVIKLNDTKVPSLQKQKRGGSNSTQKNVKESSSPDTKNEPKSMRVYSKKK